MNTLIVPSVAGYAVVERLYKGSRTEVYRALQTEPQQPVVIKVLSHHHPSFGELVQFRNQYAIARHLNHPAIVSPLALERCGNGYALVMPDEGFISLGTYSQQHALDISTVLEIAIQLAEALHYLISQRIIHKDIKPANILIHPETQQIKLIDFSIASLLPKEQQQLTNPNVLEGTLAYISPEQTGRMNRGIDYRTDFYSLGVTLFELLTGELPFPIDDPMELVHSHIAKMPAALKMGRWGDGEMGGEEIPEMISDLVMKLMAKNAEDRYQSALGLQHDLERCLHQWKATEEIIAFELGQRDISDRFLIPERLYGREQEVQTLLNAFDRVADGKTEMMLVAGFSGIGKTAVVNEVHKPITRQKGYFIQGKFDQFNRNVPLGAFVQAFRSLMEQLWSESDRQLQQWKSQILDAVGDNGQVIIEVIPELEKIIGQQPSVPELSGSAAQNRFNLLFGKFIQVFTTKKHPLVIFLDDLQWADSASLNLIKLLMSETSNSYLLMIGAYRDNEVFPAHPLMLTLDEMRKAEATINTIILRPLSVANINCLVADTLSCDGEVAEPLTELVYQKTKGNPFFTTQFLLGLYGEELIQFNREVGHWECDIAEVRQRALTDDVVEFIVGRLRKLPELTQEVLKLAACIGNRFDLETLAVVCDRTQDQVAEDLWRALQEGLVTPESETYKFFQRDHYEVATDSDIRVSYRFLHDRVQQAAYALIPQAEKEKTHYQIGKLLSKELYQENIETNIFDIVNQLNIGQALVSKQSELDELAQLNLMAGIRAKNTIAYQAGFNYANRGLSLLGNGSWERQYQLTLKLHVLATELAYLTGEFLTMESLVITINKNAREVLDKVSAIQTQIQFYASQQNYSSAITTGKNILQELGICLLEKPSFEEVKQEYINFQPYISQFTIEQIVKLPLLKDQEKLAVAKILLAIGAPAIISDTNLFWFIILKLVKLSLENGNSPYSAYAYASYGLLVNLIEQDIEKYYQFGQLSLNIVDIFPQNPTKSRVLQVVGAYTSYLKSHLREALPLLSASYICGLESGDFEYGGYSVHTKCQNLFFSGEPLTNLQTEIIQGIQALERLNNKFAIGLNQFLNQIVSKLKGQLDPPNTLESNFFKIKEIDESLTQAKDSFSLHYCYLYEAILQYIFVNKSRGLLYIKIAEDNLDSVVGWLTEYIFYFYDSLIYLDYIHHTKNLEEKRVYQYLQKVDKNQKKYKIWAVHAPMNFQHKYDLVEAEKHRALGHKFEALELYDKAIAGAKANSYIQEEALANELAAKFYLDWGKEKIATVYMQEAYYCYARWGAKAKTDHLEANYPQLLQPILQKTSQTLHPLVTLASISSVKSAVCSTTIETKSSETQINTTLDLVTLFKASQAISSTIDQEELLTQLTQILLHNSGGDRCAIILCEPNRQVQVRAIAKVDATDLSSIPLKDSSHLPVKLIQYVKNSGETVVMDSPECNIPVVDHDLAERQPASVLCLPLVDRSQLRGILYLENQATSGVFHPQRLAALQLLATQAAIALENARLYQQAQDYAQQLEESQLQLVQSEKMSALGNLVAGVAHEINNPLGFINGNITEVRHSLNDITECLQSYRQTFPKPGEKIEALLEELEIDFLIEDLPKMLNSMKVGCDRIRGISTSLRMFSRADTESQFKANVHDGIDSTLLILKYRLKARDFRPEIEVIRDYGDLPEINCFPGQLNQVFMNLLANAIDMFDEIAEGLSSKQLQANPQRITIQTQVVEPDSIEIRIRDNGKGMSEEVCSKIFDRKFTTKGVGKGTGLGLAIARQVIVEKHSGSLEVQSKIGEGTEFLIRLPR
ncbi:MAG: AAA family ATPase [Cyanobacteria bacterium J06592_8]